MEIKSNETKTDERLPWHKPEIQRLTVTLDTANGAGSSTDAGHISIF